MQNYEKLRLIPPKCIIFVSMKANGHNMQPIFLVGFMCSGKSTLGVELARQMNLRFIDLDDYIEQRQGATIVELFARIGEARFREIETEALREVSRLHDVVISCGGGTPCHGSNMALMNRLGTTVWLTTGTERIVSRLCLPEHRVKRPATADLTDEQITQMVHDTLSKREPYYSQAQLKFDSTRIETAEETIETAAQLKELLLAVGR